MGTSLATSKRRRLKKGQEDNDGRPILHYDLTAGNANGGPVALSKEIANFFVGVNDPVGQNPKGTPFDPNIFDLYLLPSKHLRSINRGEQIFNGTQINITGVTGLNDVLNQPTIPGF